METRFPETWSHMEPTLLSFPSQDPLQIEYSPEIVDVFWTEIGQMRPPVSLTPRSKSRWVFPFTLTLWRLGDGLVEQDLGFQSQLKGLSVSLLASVPCGW